MTIRKVTFAQTITIDGKEYEAIRIHKWQINDEPYDLLVGLKEIPQEPKKEWPKVFEGRYWKFDVSDDGNISVYEWTNDGKWDNFVEPFEDYEDINALSQAVELAKKLRGEK